MLEIITHFFEKHILVAAEEEDIGEKIRVASAALLMEMLHAEEICVGKKQDLILLSLENTFGLSEEQAAILMEIAEQKRVQATDYFEFTHLICEAFSHTQKIQLIESLWRVAYLDNHLDVDEEYLIDKVARLLFIPRIEVLQARYRVRGH